MVKVRYEPRNFRLQIESVAFLKPPNWWTANTRPMFGNILRPLVATQGKYKPQVTSLTRTKAIVADGEFEFSVRTIAKNLNIFCGQNEGLLKKHGSYSNQCALMDYYFLFVYFLPSFSRRVSDITSSNRNWYTACPQSVLIFRLKFCTYVSPNPSALHALRIGS